MAQLAANIEQQKESGQRQPITDELEKVVESAGTSEHADKLEAYALWLLGRVGASIQSARQGGDPLTDQQLEDCLNKLVFVDASRIDKQPKIVSSVWDRIKKVLWYHLVGLIVVTLFISAGVAVLWDSPIAGIISGIALCAWPTWIYFECKEPQQ